MFNFVSKAINTIGDLISVEEPPKQPNQPSQQPPFQRRFSGDARFFQKPARFQGPSQDDNLRIGPSSGTSIRPSSTPVYRYPTHSTTASYRPERYEESKFKAPDIDYNEGEFYLIFFFNHPVLLTISRLSTFIRIDCRIFILCLRVPYMYSLL